MRRTGSFLGLVGLILLFFGAASYLLTGVLEPYSAIHLIVGTVLIVVYLAGSFRDLGELLSARSTRYGANMVLYSVLFVALLVGVNWWGAQHNERFDLTEESVYTLAPQARQVLEGLDQDLVFQAFLEGGHDPTVERLLDSFKTSSPHVKVELVDPELQPEVTQRYEITAYGTVRVAYGEQATTVAQPTEESLTNALIKVTRAKEQTIYFVQGEGEPSIDDAQSADGYAQAKKDLENEQYRVEPLVLIQEGKVPDAADVLVLAAPARPLNAHEIEAIDVYLAAGGHAMILLPPRTGTELAPTLAKYGVVLGNDVVVDQVVRIFEGPALGLNPIVETYGAHPITEGLRERTIFPLTRTVTPGESKPGLTVTSIAKTSVSSWAETNLDALFEQSVATLEETDQGGPVSIGVASTAELEELGLGKGQARLVVYGTAAFANNQYLNTLFNRDLFLNSVGWLGGQEELVSIRPRTLRASRVQFSRDEATAIFYLSVLIVPEILLVLGLAVWWRRSRL
ncbi:MAG: hypothetical protein FJ144_08675 [Deltaproteobacteria bacterium]|nr:hypothetical protein [Deltaproteobacteria bacterium]